jgi:hypothetical protein
MIDFVDSRTLVGIVLLFIAWQATFNPDWRARFWKGVHEELERRALEAKE